MTRGGIKGLVVAAALAAAGLAACGGASEAEQASAGPTAETPRAVRVARVETRPLAGGLAASGQLVAREEASVGSELAGYRVARVLAEEGDNIRAGQPLVQLDDTLLRAQIDQAEATLQAQRVAAEQAERDAERFNSLTERGFVPQEQVERRRSTAANARAQAAAAQAQLAELQTRRSRLTIRSPVSGRVLERNVRPGDISGAGGAPYFRIARGGLIELAAEVSETDLTRIDVGDRATVQLPSGQTAEGVVRLIEPVVDEGTRLGRVRILLTPGPGQRPGGFGTAVFTQAASAGTVVPEAAVRFDANGPSVMVVGAGDRVQRVPVRTGRRAGGYVELLEGPSPGALVLLGGAAFVLEGDQVRPVLAQGEPQGGEAQPGAAAAGEAEAGR